MDFSIRPMIKMKMKINIEIQQGCNTLLIGRHDP